jgi:hypothetical protein
MPVGIGAAASVGSSIAGGVIGSNAAGDAASAAQGAASANNAYDKGILSQTTQNLQPYISGGGAAQNEIQGLEGLNGTTGTAAAQSALDTYLNSTNYKFTLNQGEQGIQYANAPSFNSGATAKALDTYATGQAGNALQGYLGELNTQSGQGEGAASTLGGLSNQTASMVNSNNNNAAGVTASSDLAAANSWTNALKGLTQQTASSGTASSFGSQSNPVSSLASAAGDALSGFG